jgi:hypothetical protein
MYCLYSVYSVTIPLHVSDLLLAHHQEVTMYIFYYYVMCSFVGLSILIVMYVPFRVFCLIVLFCV